MAEYTATPDMTFNELCAALRCGPTKGWQLLTKERRFPNAYTLGSKWLIPASDIVAYKQASRAFTDEAVA
jgi:hypothetical protein